MFSCKSGRRSAGGGAKTPGSMLVQRVWRREENAAMFTTILAPLDGSSRVEDALPLAARIARHTGAVLLLVRVVSFAAESWPAIMIAISTHGRGGFKRW